MNLFGRTIQITRRTIILVAAVALAIPLAYLAGRYGEIQPIAWQHTTGAMVSLLALGGLIGVPVGLFFGSLRVNQTGVTGQPALNKADVLAELRAELVENQQLFEARKGSATLVARLAYVSSYWTAAQSSGQLAVITNAHHLSEIALAYYWLDQANHLEQLAYDAKNGGVARDPEFTTAKLISEVRLLDEAIEKALLAALGAVADLS